MIDKFEKIILRVLIPMGGLVGVAHEASRFHGAPSVPLIVAYLGMMGLSVPAIGDYITSKSKNGGSND